MPDDPTEVSCSSCQMLLDVSSDQTIVWAYNGSAQVPLCGVCAGKKFDWRCRLCGDYAPGLFVVCSTCLAQITEQHTRQCAQCGKPFVVGTAADLWGTPYRASLSKRLCPECHSRDPKKISRILADQLNRARQANQPATLTLREWTATIEYFVFRCAYCQEQPFETMDHFIPLHLGGGTIADNCIPACRTCNTSKHTNDPDEWLERHGQYAQQAMRIRAYLAYLRRGESPAPDAAETATISLSEPSRWGRYILVTFSDWPEKVEEYHPKRRVYWKAAHEWMQAAVSRMEPLHLRGYRPRMSEEIEAFRNA